MNFTICLHSSLKIFARFNSATIKCLPELTLAFAWEWPEKLDYNGNGFKCFVASSSRRRRRRRRSSPSNVYKTNSLRTMHNCTLDARHQTSDAHTHTYTFFLNIISAVSFFFNSSFSSYFNLSYLPAAVTVVPAVASRAQQEKWFFLMLRSELSRKIKQQLNRKINRMIRCVAASVCVSVSQNE